MTIHIHYNEHLKIQEPINDINIEGSTMKYYSVLLFLNNAWMILLYRKRETTLVVTTFSNTTY